MGGYDSIIDISLHSLYSSMNHQVFGGGVGTKLTCTHPFWLLSWPTIFSSMCAPRSKQDHGWMEGSSLWNGFAPLKLIWQKCKPTTIFNRKWVLGFRTRVFSTQNELIMYRVRGTPCAHSSKMWDQMK